MSDLSALGVTLALLAIGVAIMGVRGVLERIATEMFLARSCPKPTPPSPER